MLGKGKKKPWPVIRGPLRTALAAAGDQECQGEQGERGGFGDGVRELPQGERVSTVSVWLAVAEPTTITTYGEQRPELHFGIERLGFLGLARELLGLAYSGEISSSGTGGMGVFSREGGSAGGGVAFAVADWHEIVS